MQKKITLYIFVLLTIISALSCASAPKKEAAPEAAPPVVAKTEPEPKPEPVAQPVVVETPKSEGTRQTIYFAPLSYKIDTISDKAISIAANDIKLKAVKHVKIVGHSAMLDTAKEEDALSLKRAETVASYLIELGVVTSDNVEVVGMGSKEPAAPHSDMSRRWLNRRVELIY